MINRQIRERGRIHRAWGLDRGERIIVGRHAERGCGHDNNSGALVSNENANTRKNRTYAGKGTYVYIVRDRQKK